MGVARAANLSDANLTHWLKDPQNPISFPGMRSGFAGPSNIFFGPDGNPNIIMALGRSMARFESSDPSLHNWSIEIHGFLHGVPTMVTVQLGCHFCLYLGVSMKHTRL